MKAIILAAGVGRRLSDSVTEHPKCLLKLGGRTLLDRMLGSLEAVGISEVVIVVGHLGEQIRNATAERGNVRTLVNPNFRKGAVLSLWTAREELDDEVVIMTADVLFPTELLRRLVDSPHPDCVLLDPTSANDGEAQMLMGRQGRLHDIARGLRGEFDVSGEYVGFMKLSREGAAAFRRLLTDTVEAGQDSIEPEGVFPALMREREIRYEPADDFSWIEIDFPEDLARATQLIEEGAVPA